MPHVRAFSLSKSFGTTNVLNQIDLDLPQGSFLALLGPSGCGKTTLLRLIAGLELPDAGELRFDDQLIATSGHFVPPERRDLGMVFQSYALWPNMTVRGNVAFALQSRRMTGTERRARVDQMLTATGLLSLADRRPQDLSGGQRQRVALARSLALRPGLLLLDEPLANLDAHLRQQMLVQFRQLHAETGATFILVTHDQDEAMTVATHIAVMDRGQIQQMGCPEDLYRRPATPMVARFIGHGVTVPVEVTGTLDGICDLHVGTAAVRLPGTAQPGPGWLCLHREDLRLCDGPGHIHARILSQSFQHGHYLTHALTDALDDQMLTLLVDRPLTTHTPVGLEITGGWVIGRDADKTSQAGARREAVNA